MAWLAGLAWFAGLVPRDSRADPAATDAIVVLTGGSQRVENGLTLLAEGKAKKFFVSGVYRSTDVKALLRATSQKPEWLTCCIELGHEADNTPRQRRRDRGLDEGGEFPFAAPRHRELSHAAQPAGIFPRHARHPHRAQPGLSHRRVHTACGGCGPHAAMLVIGEYVKYLFALTGLQSLGPAP